MTIGFKKDKQIKTENIDLYKYGIIYFPSHDYYNSEPLPMEWLELIEDYKKLRELYSNELKH